ncbi:MAG: DUF354 domain-containing protein [Chloroflexi bacterium]|nr:MAG: DUF354 domain-containing protein [Chloroflexota bacterium]MBL1193153.1 DUF354 domain-containing protein [Chloroflexota bacterium]NOH10446.1 DUF354 domain-containing protein [Chloroflexota bacterium]
MRVLVDISHPAHFHFFKYVIEAWRQRGHQVTIASRDKDITLELLDAAKENHYPLSTARRGVFGLGVELLEHESALYRLVKEHKPDVLLQVGGTFIVHVGRLTGTKSIVFYDTENATVSNFITYPFADAICTPASYKGDIGAKHVRYDGFQELAYLHPNWFVPDKSVLDRVGVEDGNPFSLVRFVGWDSGHDVNLNGFSRRGKEQLISELAALGKVFISSEGSLPLSLQNYELDLPKSEIHHLMAFANLCVGESATMASEAAILGTPAVFLSPVGRGYTDEQEQKYGLVYNYDAQSEDEAISRAVELFADTEIKKKWLPKREMLLADKIDVTAWMVDFVEEFVKKP